jgi:hypothetical protein
MNGEKYTSFVNHPESRLNTSDLFMDSTWIGSCLFPEATRPRPGLAFNPWRRSPEATGRLRPLGFWTSKAAVWDSKGIIPNSCMKEPTMQMAVTFRHLETDEG